MKEVPRRWKSRGRRGGTGGRDVKRGWRWLPTMTTVPAFHFAGASPLIRLISLFFRRVPSSTSLPRPLPPPLSPPPFSVVPLAPCAQFSRVSSATRTHPARLSSFQLSTLNATETDFTAFAISQRIIPTRSRTLRGKMRGSDSPFTTTPARYEDNTREIRERELFDDQLSSLDDAAASNGDDVLGWYK